MKHYRPPVPREPMSFATDSWQQMLRSAPNSRSAITARKPNQEPPELQFPFPIAKMRQQEVSDLKSSLDFAFDIEIVMQIRFGQANLCPRQKHSPERIGMFQRECRLARPIVRPHCSVPQPHADFVQGAVSENFAVLVPAIGTNTNFA